MQRVTAKGIVTTREGLAVLSPSHCPNEEDTTEKPMAPESASLTRGLAELRTRLRGQLLEPADAGYGDARRIWKAMIDKRPRYIVRCADVTDVQRAVTSRASTACRCLSAAAATTLPASRCATTA